MRRLQRTYQRWYDARPVGTTAAYAIGLYLVFAVVAHLWRPDDPWYAVVMPLGAVVGGSAGAFVLAFRHRAERRDREDDIRPEPGRQDR